MSEKNLQITDPELIKQVRDVNDLCHAAFNFFGKSAESERKAGEYRSSRIKRTVWGIILTAIVFPLGVNIVFTIILGFFRTDIGPGFYLAFFPFAVISVVVLANLYFRRFAKAPLKTEMKLRKQSETERTKAESIFIDNAEVFSIIPEKYCVPLVTQYIYETLRTGRAQTLNEALDKADEQVHRWTLERNSAASLALQVEQLKTLRRIEFNTFWL